MVPFFIFLSVLPSTLCLSHVPSVEQHNLIATIRKVNHQLLVDRQFNGHESNENVERLLQNNIKALQQSRFSVWFIYLQYYVNSIGRTTLRTNMVETLSHLVVKYQTILSWCGPQILPTNTFNMCTSEGCVGLLVATKSMYPCGFIHFHNVHLLRSQYSLNLRVNHLFHIQLTVLKMQIGSTYGGNIVTVLGGSDDVVLHRFYGNHPRWVLATEYNHVVVDLNFNSLNIKTIIDLKYDVIDMQVMDLTTNIVVAKDMKWCS